MNASTPGPKASCRSTCAARPGAWNTTSAAEKQVLDGLISTYKKYYFEKMDVLKEKISEEKQYNIESYLTYDAEYYVNQFNSQMEEINKCILCGKKFTILEEFNEHMKEHMVEEIK